MRQTAIALLAAAAAVLARPLAAGELKLATTDGLELGLDDRSGDVSSLRVGGVDATDPSVRGGLFVRDRQHLTDVPPGAVNLLPNGSFETDADGNGMPDGWIFEDNWYGGATVSYGPPASQGLKGITIHTKAGGQIVALDVPVTPGTRYLVQAQTQGTAAAEAYVIWKSAAGDFLLYESGHPLAASGAWAPVHLMVTAPFSARLADVYLISVADGDLSLDQARMYPAPPQAYSAVAGPLVATPFGARQTTSLPALGLDLEATWTARSDRIDLDLLVTDTRRQDRAIEAGLVLPVLPSRFWDSLRTSRPVLQRDGSEIFAYTWWGRMYNDGPWGHDRSAYPFAAVTLGSGDGLAMGYDVAQGPQDVQFFHSTYIGESFTSLFRLGLAPEPRAFPRQARFRLSLFRVDGADAFRSALERTYRNSPGSYENRLPEVGGWIPWIHPKSIPGAADFGLAVHTWDDDVLADDRASVLTFGYLGSSDYWLPLGDFASRPSQQDARNRLDFNATQAGVDPTLQRDARSVQVSGLHDAALDPLLEVYQAGWMPGSGWSAVCAIDPDPEVADTTGRGWSSRWSILKGDLDQRFVRAQGAGARLDGAFLDWLPSWHADAWNHRRSQWVSTDVPLSFDPATLTPALPEAFSHFDSTRTVAAEMRAQGRFTMARNVDFRSFWASPLLDAMGQEVEWPSYPGDDEELSFYRAAAGRKPYMMIHDADFASWDVAAAVQRSLLYGLLPAANWDTAAGKYFWEEPALVERDRPLYRRFLPLFRLESRAGWQPVTHATMSQPEVYLERWGDRAAGRLLFSAWNSGAAPARVRLSVDLAALGVAPGEVGRVIDLVEKGVVPASASGPTLRLDDVLDPGAARLYHLHLAAPGGSLVLRAVKAGADVRLSWGDLGRAPYELLAGGDRALAGAGVSLAPAPGFVDQGGLSGASRYYAVE